MVFDEHEETLGESMGMTLEEFLGFEEDTTEEPVGVVFDNDTYDLFKVDFSNAVLSTHRAIADALEARVGSKSEVLRFYSDFTGRGKTSGAILSLGEMIESGQADRVLFLTREIAGVEEVYRHFSNTWPNINVIPWSGAHRGEGKIDVIRNNITRDEAKKAQVVISTHAAGKLWRKHGDYPLGKDFDLVLIDEYPDPVAGGQFHLSEAEALSEKYYRGPMGEQAQAVRDWMRELQNNRGRIPKPDWAKGIDPRFPKEVRELAEAVRQGRSFVVTRGKHRSLHWSKLNMPFEERALLCSATNELEGWQMDPRVSLNHLKEHRGIPTDYSQMNVTFKPWPSEPARTQNPELGDKYTVAVLQDQILREVAHNLPKNNEETLILMPKTLKDNLTEDFKRQVQKCRSNAKVHFHHWGSGIGTNAYKNCRYAIVVGLFHQNAFGLRQKINGHKLHKSDQIQTYGVNSNEVTATRNNEHARHIIQMLNRIRIRNMDESHSHPYIAKSAQILWVATPEDTDLACEVLQKAFDKVKIDRSQVLNEVQVVDDPRLVKGWGAKAQVICRQMEKIGKESFTSKDLDTTWGGYPKDTRQRRCFRSKAEDLGWIVTQGDGRGKPTVFTKR